MTGGAIAIGWVHIQKLESCHTTAADADAALRSRKTRSVRVSCACSRRAESADERRTKGFVVEGKEVQLWRRGIFVGIYLSHHICICRQVCSWMCLRRRWLIFDEIHNCLGAFLPRIFLSYPLRPRLNPLCSPSGGAPSGDVGISLICRRITRGVPDQDGTLKFSRRFGCETRSLSSLVGSGTHCIVSRLSVWPEEGLARQTFCA